MSEIEPAEVFCLAEFLCDEMIARGWTTDDVGTRMNTLRGPYMNIAVVDLLMAVQKDGLLIDDETFAGLASAFDVSETCLRNLDATWRKWPDRRSPFSPPESIYGPLSRSMWRFPEDDAHA